MDEIDDLYEIFRQVDSEMLLEVIKVILFCIVLTSGEAADFLNIESILAVVCKGISQMMEKMRRWPIPHFRKKVKIRNTMYIPLIYDKGT